VTIHPEKPNKDELANESQDIDKQMINIESQING